MDAEDSKRVEQLADAFLEELRSGFNPSISDYARRHPAYARQIRDLFPTLQVLEEFRPESTDHPGRRHEAVRGSLEHTDLGEFHLLREIGRGGMGIVYEAEQASLGRRVAVKVLSPTSWRSTTYLERFQLEVRSAARLHHTNIVPVYGVGEHDGVYFYAMQFIAGRSLDEVVAVLRSWREGSPDSLRSPSSSPSSSSPPMERLARDLLDGKSTGRARFRLSSGAQDGSDTWTLEDHGETTARLDHDRESATVHGGRPYHRSVAWIGLQVAEGLQYAHSQGILHRDIKPSNLLLDLRGTVWITDFGLAKCEDENLTQSGDIIGTLRYMAPERLQGESDARTDVYSIGMTLYELLALQPAFDQADRGQLVREIMGGGPQPLRKLDARIPRDLETIVLKAIDREPSHRYQSAGDLARDLRSFLDDMPIEARRIRWRERTWRWCRRNPLPAALSASVAALLLIVAIGGAWTGLQMSRQAKSLRDERNLAVRSLERAETAEAVGRRRLFESWRVAARAGRQSGQEGQRFQSLDTLLRAADLSMELEIGPFERRALRNELLATLALTDLRVEAVWDSESVLCFDAELDRYADGALVPEPAGTVIIRATEDRRVLAQLPGWGHRPVLARFSPDDRFLAVKYHGSKIFLGLWRLEPEPILIVRVENGVHDAALSFSPDGRELWAGRADGTIDRYAIPDGVLRTPIQPSSLVASTISFDAKGERVALGSRAGADVLVLDAATGALQRRFRCEGGVGDLAWSPNGGLLAAGCDDNQIYIWNMTDASDAPRCRLAGHVAPVTDVRFHPTGHLASAAWDGTTRLWDVERQVQLVQAYGELVEFDTAGHRLGFRSATRGGIWEVAFPQLRTLLTTGGAGIVWDVAMDGTGRFAAAGTSRGLLFWDPNREQELAFQPIGETLSTAFHPDGEDLVTSGRSGSYRWPVRDHEPEDTIRVGPPTTLVHGLDPPGRAQLSGDGSWLIATNRSGHRTLVAPWSDPASAILIPPRPQVEHVAISPDGRWAATGTWQGTGVQVWDRIEGVVVADLMRDSGSARVEFSPDGRRIVASAGDAYWIWEVETWRLLHRVARSDDQGLPGAMAFHPDGELLAVANPLHAVSLLRIGTLEEVARLETDHRDTIASLCFTPCGRRVAIGRRGYLQIWDLAESRRTLARADLDWGPQPPQHSPGMELPPVLTVDVRTNPPRSAAAATSTDPTRARMEQYDRAIAGNPDDGMAYYRRAMLHEQLGRNEQADADYAAALERFSRYLADAPDDATARHYRGHVLQRAGNYRDAAIDFGVALEREPDSTHLLAFRGLAWHCAEEYSLAIDDYERCLTYSEDAGVCQRLAWLLVTGPPEIRDPNRALPLARAAARSSAASATNTATLALVYCRLERYELALEQLAELSTEQQSEHLPSLVRAVTHALAGDVAAGEPYRRQAAQVPPPGFAFLRVGIDALHNEADELFRD